MAMMLARPCTAAMLPTPIAAEPRLEPAGERVLAVHAEAEAGERDAELRRGDVAVLLHRRGQDREQPPRQPIALSGPGLDRRSRRADDGELRRHEQRVGAEEREDHEDDDHAGVPGFPFAKATGTGPFAEPRTARAGWRNAPSTSCIVTRPATAPAASMTMA